MKFQVVLSTGGIFETFFFAALQAITYQNICLSHKTSLYQVLIILDLICTVNLGSKLKALNQSSISNMTMVVTSITI